MFELGDQDASQFAEVAARDRLAGLRFSGCARVVRGRFRFARSSTEERLELFFISLGSVGRADPVHDRVEERVPFPVVMSNFLLHQFAPHLGRLDLAADGAHALCCCTL